MHTFWSKKMTQQQFITTVERKFNKQTVVSCQVLNDYDMAVQAHLFIFVAVHGAKCGLTVPVLSSEGTVPSKLQIELKEAVKKL